MAVLSVTGSAARYRDEGHPIWIDVVSRAAEEISQALGFHAGTQAQAPGVVASSPFALTER
jgi:hypothetical protein